MAPPLETSTPKNPTRFGRQSVCVDPSASDSTEARTFQHEALTNTEETDGSGVRIGQRAGRFDADAELLRGEIGSGAGLGRLGGIRR